MTTERTPTIDVDNAARRVIGGDCVLLDVREPVEWMSGRAPGAGNPGVII